MRILAHLDTTIAALTVLVVLVASTRDTPGALAERTTLGEPADRPERPRPRRRCRGPPRHPRAHQPLGMTVGIGPTVMA
jgi:hypothetical protein